VNYTSHSAEDRKRMLDAIGLPSVPELIQRIIPDKFLLKEALRIPKALAEAELVKEFERLAAENAPAGKAVCLMGGGVYNHYIPAAVNFIINRPEFYTAYTPYQAEVAQGTLQTIYEFQTMVCRLTGMDAANASLYDGATALAEAVMLAVRKNRKPKVLVPFGLNPGYREVLNTYGQPSNIAIEGIDHQDGLICLNDLRRKAGEASAVIIQHPNFFGLLEPVEEAAQIAQAAGAMVISSTYPMSLALLKPPGEWGADIATAEGQSLGVPMSLGGPYVGLFAVKQALIRLMPGRLAARAKDREGREGFVLTLQTREQHIRREKATSNICTNQALVALTALVYLSLMGPDGLRRAASNSYRSAHYLAAEVERISGCRRIFRGEFFNEFAVELPVKAEAVQKSLLEQGLQAGPALGKWFPGMERALLLAATEQLSKRDIDLFVSALKRIAAGA